MHSSSSFGRALPPLGALRASPTAPLAPLTHSRLRPLAGDPSMQHASPGLAAASGPLSRLSSLEEDSRMRPTMQPDQASQEQYQPAVGRGPTTRLDFGREPVRPPPVYGGDLQPAYAQAAPSPSGHADMGRYDQDRAHSTQSANYDPRLGGHQQQVPYQRRDHAFRDEPPGRGDPGGGGGRGADAGQFRQPYEYAHSAEANAYSNPPPAMAASNEVGRMSQDGARDPRYQQQQQQAQWQPPQPYGQPLPLSATGGTPQSRPFDPNDPRHHMPSLPPLQQSHDPQLPQQQPPYGTHDSRHYQPHPPQAYSQSVADEHDASAGVRLRPPPPLMITDPNGVTSPSGSQSTSAALQLAHQRTPGRMGAGPLTPQRAAFSPHAAKSGSLASPAHEQMLSPASADSQRMVGQPAMQGLEELLSPPALQVYLPYFLRLPRQPALTLESVLALDDLQTEDLLDEVESFTEDQGGIHMKGSHKHHILTRIKQERIKREAEKRRAMSPAHSGKNQFGTMSPQNVAGSGVQYIPPGEQATTNVIFRDGLRGLVKHWCCCFGLCIFLVLVATAFMLLYQQVGKDALGSSGSSSGVNGSSVSSTSAGGWKFVFILSILGFVFAGLALLLSCFSWLRNPDHRNCDCRHLMPDCTNCSLKDLCCSCPSMPTCDCCDSCGCGGCTGEVKAGCSSCYASVREECHLPECPELACADCCGCHACKDCIHECGCHDCCECPGLGVGCCSCDDCCRDCATPTCDCNCCPDIEGDCSSCCSTLYKVCCCQCKIQVS